MTQTLVLKFVKKYKNYQHFLASQLKNAKVLFRNSEMKDLRHMQNSYAQMNLSKWFAYVKVVPVQALYDMVCYLLFLVAHHPHLLSSNPPV